MWKSNGLNNTCRKRINDTSRKHKQANGKHPERKCACDADRKMRAGVKNDDNTGWKLLKSKKLRKIGENRTLLSREHLSNRWKLIPLIPHQDPTTKGGRGREFPTPRWQNVFSAHSHNFRMPQAWWVFRQTRIVQTLCLDVLEVF